ncbi:hypothetical protein [Alkalihalobacillus sp. BA299]|uniref:hypothetical protein n=1 Tax=Alkalihalobacillus sp. BA299 TaxID=2815938 RepID=UPI001AD9CB68|nr:hypothetical protein [Alkalihalobacillus sp. BA299]
MEKKNVKQLDIFSMNIEPKEPTEKAKEPERENIEVDEVVIQLDSLDEQFQVKDFVEIIRTKNKVDPSDELYVSEFIGKKGTIVEIEKKSNPIAYWVDFGKSRGIFYASDMRFIR